MAALRQVLELVEKSAEMQLKLRTALKHSDEPAAKDYRVADLPFVVGGGRKSKRDFWHVQPTDVYFDDCLTGERFALEYLRYLKANTGGIAGVLLSIVGSVSLRLGERERSGIEVGFFNTLDYAARFSLPLVERRLAHNEELYRQFKGELGEGDAP